MGAWTWTLRGESDASFSGSAQGTDVGEVSAADFQAPANLHAQLAGMETNVVAQGDHAFSPAGITVAVAEAHGLQPTASLTVTMPDGSAQTCSCAFTRLAPSMPGDRWTFHLTQTDATSGPADPVILYARNLQLPS